MIGKFCVVFIKSVVIIGIFVFYKYFFFIRNLKNSGIDVYGLICSGCLFGIYFGFIEYYLEVYVVIIIWLYCSYELIKFFDCGFKYFSKSVIGVFFVYNCGIIGYDLIGV